MNHRLLHAAWFTTLFACAGTNGSVTRVIDGRVLEGHFVSPTSYELFLQGAMAEESGALDQAINAFDQATRIDSSDALLWVRLGTALCKKDVHDARISVAINSAIKLDRDFGPALGLRASCGNGSVTDADLAMKLEPANVDLAITMQQFLAAHSHADADADRSLALTLAHPSNVSWLALLEWSTRHERDSLVELAATELARRSTLDFAAVILQTKTLAGDGALASARKLASVLVDRSERGTGLTASPASDPLVARLAIDEALLRGDQHVAVARASRSHVTLTDVAARAHLLGQTPIALNLATLVMDADPKNAEARLVLAAVGEATHDAKLLVRAFLNPPPSDAPPSASVALVFFRALATASSDQDARLFSLAPMSFLGTDAVLVPLAVDLAARGVISSDSFPPEARLELALRRRENPNSDVSVLDARHRFLALSRLRPTDIETRALAARLARRAPGDPLIGAGILHLAEASGEPVDAVSLSKLSDPIAIAAVLESMKTHGPANDLALAKARLAGVAATPAERSLANF